MTSSACVINISSYNDHVFIAVYHYIMITWYSYIDSGVYIVQKCDSHNQTSFLVISYHMATMKASKQNSFVISKLHEHGYISTNLLSTYNSVQQTILVHTTCNYETANICQYTKVSWHTLLWPWDLINKLSYVHGW